jgi:hypothetical protein
MSTHRPEPAPGSTPNGTSNGDARVGALAGEVERLARGQAQLAETVIELDGLVRRLGEDLTSLATDLARDEDQPPLASWLSIDDEQRAELLLADLVAWLDRVYRRYADSALPSCWAWHPEVVEELWWLRQAHRVAYESPRASWPQVADWHDRHRPAVAARIRAAIGSCELDRHRPGGDREHPDTTVPLPGDLTRLAARWAGDRAAPVPTDTQLDEAARHDRAQHRRGRR